MDADQHSLEPDFSTLTGIMDYFSKVPFETFKKDLDNWFIQEINKKQIEMKLKEGHGSWISSKFFPNQEMDDLNSG